MKKKLLEGKNKIQEKNSDRLFRLKTSFLPKKCKGKIEEFLFWMTS